MHFSMTTLLLLLCTVTTVLCVDFEVITEATAANRTNITKPGICPRLSSEEQPSCFDFISQCEFDSDCQGEQKCCDSGCGNLCTHPVYTGCQQIRTLLSHHPESHGKRIFAPKCTEDGKFEDVQCDEESGNCWCVDDLGFELAGTRHNSSDLVNCSAPRPCAGVLCRMLCPYGFQLDNEGCPLCRCRNPCEGVSCPGEQECQLEEVPCAEDVCPPLPTCKQPRRLHDLCPMGTPLTSPDNGNPFLCGVEPNKPQCPLNYLCDVLPGNDYGVCCPLVDKTGQCPTELHDGEKCELTCTADMDCSGVNKCCPIEGCGMTCTKPANTTLCLQQKAVVELLLSGNDGYEGYIPQCLENGEFSPKQCSANGHLCWCVATNGTIITGSMGPKDKVECEGSSTLELEGRTQVETKLTFGCNALSCDLHCEAGYKYDGKGCKICECAEPCKDIACPDGMECILMKTENCLKDENCVPIATCRDTAVQCSWGRALHSNTTGALVVCPESECPGTHNCEVKDGGAGICCPKMVDIEHTKSSECPDYIYEPDQCISTCNSDDQCTEDMKCCPSKSCGAICVPPKPPKPPTMCEYIRDSEQHVEKSGMNATLAISLPQCLDDGTYNPVQCNANDNCWCVDDFGVEILNTRSSGQLDCEKVRSEMACLGLICRLGCDFGFVMDEDGCPLCSCRNPCQNATCGVGETCQFLEVNCQDDWCPPLPYCMPLEAAARNFPTCPSGTPLMYEYDNELVTCDPFSNYPQCPSSHDCIINNPREIGVCCPRIEDDVLLEKKGQCPYLIPMQSESCENHCSVDQDCEDDTKCCSNGCGTHCTDPILKTACQHLKSAAEHRAIEMGVPASRMYMPNCTEQGDFAAVQCEPVTNQCWCSDSSGFELPGTRVNGREKVTCIPETENCPVSYCHLPCHFGYEMDSNGCPKCECKDPCKDVKCRSSQESCRLVDVNCMSESCLPIPLCLPAVENPCPIGEPLTDGEFGAAVQCGPQGEQCPSSHRCHLSPFREYAVCCPKPIVSTCEQLKRRNQQLRKIHNRVTFLPKCNRKTGAWDPTQCMEALGLCWCVDPEGNQLPGTLVRGVPHCTARSSKSLKHMSICNDGEDVHICPEDLCEGKICLAHPNATCNIDPCGGCKVQFLDDYNKPIDCNKGLTACFAEVQTVINSGVLKPKDILNDDILPALEEVVDEITSPPPAYPPPPPPPQYRRLKREAILSYNINPSHPVYFEIPQQEQERDIQAVPTSERHVMFVPPRMRTIEIKMVPPIQRRLSPLIETVPFPMKDLVGSDPIEILGFSQRFTIVDDGESSFLVKPGSCPAPSLLSILHSISQGCDDKCSSDFDCPGNLKCCLYSCGLGCTSPFLAPMEKPVEKQGKCPTLLAGFMANPFGCMFAKRMCFTDEECGNRQRCCPTLCGSQCVDTITEKEDVIVKPVSMQAAAPRCSVEGGYAITQRQGELSWCVDQFGKPLHETLTRGDVECDSNGTVVSRVADGPVCGNSKMPRVCKEECLSATCLSHPDATCVADPCDECRITFVSPDGMPVTCEGKCKQPLRVGKCRSSLPRFYFSQRSQKCEQFYYGGCQGNENNFEALETCQEQCEKPVPRCEQPKEVGLCRAQIFRWYYNKQTHQCEKFIYGGCGGNDNNFEMKEECEAICPDQVMCSWANVNGEDMAPCSRSAACANATCPGDPEAYCTVDSCSCRAHFISKSGTAASCTTEKADIPQQEEMSASLRAAAFTKYTRCQSLSKKHLLSGDLVYIPQCNEDGQFYPTQCSRQGEKQCWCVDEAGIQLPSTSTFEKGTKTCDYVKIKKIEVTLAFNHDEKEYSEKMKPAIKKLMEQFLRDLEAESTGVELNVLPETTRVMFSLVSDNKVNVAFQLDEMMKMGNIAVILPKFEMTVNYAASHFHNILDYEVEDIDDNSIASSRINDGDISRSEYNWALFAVFLAIGCIVLFLVFYIIPAIIRKHKKEKVQFDEEDKPSLVSMVFHNVRYGLSSMKLSKASPSEEKAQEAPKVVVQTVEAQYEELQKKPNTGETDSLEGPPAYDNISEKDAKTDTLEKC